MCKGSAEKIFGKDDVDKVRYIPYRTIGNDNGVMKLMQIEKIYVKGDGGVKIEKPLIAISEGKISKEDEYQMILNPNLF